MGKNKCNFFAARCILLCFILYIFVGFIQRFIFSPGTYEMFDYSEMMINYEGGFVRRGLMGQVLLSLYNVVPYNFFALIKIFNIIVSLCYLWLMVHIFRKEGWSPMVLCLGCGFLFIIFNTWSRKDLLLLLMAYGIYTSYRNFVQKKSLIYLIFFEVLSVLQLLIHEAAFFFTFPILIVYTCSCIWNEKQRNIQSYSKAIVPFLPILLVFLLVSFFKGDENVANIIWQSWYGVMKAYPDGQNSVVMGGQGVKALAWQALPTFLYHLRTTYLGVDTLMWRIPIHVIFQLANFGFVYYFTTKINTVNPKLYSLALEDNGMKISNFMLVQFVFMLPMFTILSCDVGRTLPYWVFSSLMACHIFGTLNIPWVDKISQKLQAYLSYSWLNKPFCYLLLMLLVPIPPYGAPGWKNCPLMMVVDMLVQTAHNFIL